VAGLEALPPGAFGSLPSVVAGLAIESIIRAMQSLQRETRDVSNLGRRRAPRRGRVVQRAEGMVGRIEEATDMKQGYTEDDIRRGNAWLIAHREHVLSLIQAEGHVAYPATGSDIIHPELWKPAHWRYFVARFPDAQGAIDATNRRAHQMTPLERMARAYAAAWKADIEAHLPDYKGPLPTWEEMGPDQRAAMIRCARAAAQALMEPSLAMLEAARKSIVARGAFTNETFGAMLHAALDEGP